MTQDQLDKLLDACKSVPVMMIGGTTPSSPQENANNAWKTLGKEMGFKHMTVKPNGKGDRFFSAEVVEREYASTEAVDSNGQW